MLKDDLTTLDEEKVFLNYEKVGDVRDTFTQHYSSDKLGYIYVMSDEEFVKYVLIRQAEAALKDRNPAVGSSDEVSDVDPMTPTMVIDELPELLETDKAVAREPLYKLLQGLNTTQAEKVISLRKSLRRG
jgi:hypothetical protein